MLWQVPVLTTSAAGTGLGLAAAEGALLDAMIGPIGLQAIAMLDRARA